MKGHTPGPWTFTKVKIIEAPSALVAKVYDIENADGEMFANMSLIAAAPDLLATCQRLLEWFRIGGIGKHVADGTSSGDGLSCGCNEAQRTLETVIATAKATR